MPVRKPPKPDTATALAKRYLYRFEGQTMTRTELIDNTFKSGACNRFKVSDIRRMAEECGVTII